jgi:hypothetical protein
MGHHRRDKYNHCEPNNQFSMFGSQQSMFAIQGNYAGTSCGMSMPNCSGNGATGVPKFVTSMMQDFKKAFGNMGGAFDVGQSFPMNYANAGSSAYAPFDASTLAPYQGIAPSPFMGGYNLPPYQGSQYMGNGYDTLPQYLGGATATANATASVNGLPTYDYNYSTSPTTANASAFASATAGVPADPNLAAILAMLGNSGYSLTNATATSTPFDPNALAYADTTGGGLPSYLTEPGYSPASDPYLSQALASYQSQPS